MDPFAKLASLVRPISNRVKVLAQRGVVRSSDDATKAQTVTVGVLAGETLSKVERFAHFGLTTRPPVGSEVVVLCLGGNRDHPVVIADEARASRPVGELEPGDACLYSSGGARVIVRASGAVEVLAAAGLTIAGDVEVTGNLETTGDLADALGTLAALRAAYNAHVHPDPQGGSTGPPVPTV